MVIISRDKVLILDCGGTLSSQLVNGQYQPVAGVVVEQIRTYFPHLLDYIEYQVVELFDSSDINYSRYTKILESVSAALTKSHYRGIVITHGTDTLALTGAILTFAFPFTPIPIVLTAAQIPLIEAMSDGRANLFGAIIVAFGNNSLVLPQKSVSLVREWNLPTVMTFVNYNVKLACRVIKFNTTDVQAFAQLNHDVHVGQFVHQFECNYSFDKKLVAAAALTAVRFGCVLHTRDESLPTRLPIRTTDAENLLKDHERKHIEALTVEQLALRPHCSSHIIRSDCKYYLAQILLDKALPPPADILRTGLTPVGVVRLFPAINEETLEAIANISLNESGKRCLIISAYGTGNGPQIVQNWLIKRQDTFAVICTQCPAGGVSSDYAASLASRVEDNRPIRLQNVALCDDLTTEAAIGKLSCYFNNYTLPSVVSSMIKSISHTIPPGEPTHFSVLKYQMETAAHGELTTKQTICPNSAPVNCDC